MAEWFAQFQADFKLNFIDQGRWRWLLEGLGNTLTITFFALLIGSAVLFDMFTYLYNDRGMTRVFCFYILYIVYKQESA